MSKLRMKFGVVMMLTAAIVLSACGNKEDNKISDGVSNMKTVLTDVQKAVDAGDAAKAKTEAANLEEAWAKFEDNVKDKSKELYEKAETPLHVIEAGAGVDPLDKEVLTKSVNELNQVLDEINK
ncbi:conserved hypothetical protein [Paenibacillus curdlanolyticus YK9]|uniref:Lipoprotein n=1 Tax=Paenibacillus curdlanolyticus YK9 TaxID=717606 RepID=E0IFG5_9BACL|nr:hypothetical protein [Paenibacillus curdlanolyticus]EFM08941.1 conserved hypothetical protein [Paenibacillus curdlanolyticus YK9]